MAESAGGLYGAAFGNYTPQQLGDNLSKGLEVSKKNYEYDQQKNLDKAFAESLAIDGNAYGPTFYARAKEYGLSPEQVRKHQEYRKFQVESAADIMQKRADLKAMGIDVDAMGRGEPPATPPATQEKPKEALTFSNIFGSLRELIVPKTKAISSGAPPATSTGNSNNYMGSDLPLVVRTTPAESSQSPSDNSQSPESSNGNVPVSSNGQERSPDVPAVPGKVDGVVNVPGGDFTPKAFPMELNTDELKYGAGNKPETETPKPDNRTYQEKLEDSYDASKDIYNTQPSAITSPKLDDPRFSFNANNDGDKYQQFDAAAKKLIVDGGQAKSVQEYLKSVYDTAAGKVTPVPPNPALRTQGTEGRVKWMAEKQKYDSDLAKQDAAGWEAVIAEKKRIADYAQTVGVNKAAQTAQNLTLEQRTWDRASRQAVTDLGFDPNKINPQEARDLDARRTLLNETKKLASASKDDLMGKNGSEAQYAAIVPLMNALSRIENASTISGQSKLETAFSNINPSVGQAFKEEGVAGAAKAMRALIATDSKSGYESLMKLLDDSEKHGQLYSDLNAARKKPLTNEDIAKSLGIKNKEQSTPKEGTTKKNKQGVDVVYKNGKWELK